MPKIQKTRTLRAAIAIAFAVLTLFIILNAAIGAFSIHSVSAGFSRLINQEIRTVQLATETKAQFVEADYLLHNFTHSRNLFLAEKGQANLKLAYQSIEELLLLAGEGQKRNTVQSLQRLLNDYSDLYENYIDSMNAIGLDENSGYQGTFREDAHLLEEVFLSLNREDLMVEYLTLRRHEKNFLLRKNAQYINSAQDILDVLREGLSQLLSSTENREIYGQEIDSYEKHFIDLAEETLRNGEILAELENITETIIPLLKSLVEDSTIQVAGQLDQSGRIQSILLIVLAAIVASSVAVAVIFALRVFRRLSGPMKKILKVTDNIAEGRLNKRAGLTRMDEMGQIGANIDRAAEGLSELIRAIKKAVEEGLGLSDRLSSVAEETATAITQVSANIDSIDKRTDDMNNTAGAAGSQVSEIVERLDNLSSAAADQSSSVTQSTASIEEMVASIKSVNEISDEKNKSAAELTFLAEQSRDGVRETGKLVEEISALTESTQDAIVVINAVASRTNLLAMNAAIEAAHAGDAGRGFAVVADEIRKLAESTGENAKSIRESLGSMISRIALVKESSNSSIQAMEQMATDVKGFTSSFAEISSSMSEMSIGSREVLGASEALALLTENLNRSIEDMKGEAISVSNGMESMTNLSEQVSTGVGEIGRASSEISDAAVSLSKDGDENRTLMGRIRDLADRFTV